MPNDSNGPKFDIYDGLVAVLSGIAGVLVKHGVQNILGSFNDQQKDKLKDKIVDVAGNTVENISNNMTGAKKIK